MSKDKPNPPKRRVVVRLTAREKQDPVALMAAVRNALLGHNISLVCQPVGDPNPLAVVEPPTPTIPDDELATKARELVGATLDAAAAEAEKKAANANRDAAMMAEEVAAARSGLRAYLSYWFGQGVRISVELYEKVTGAIAEAVGKKKGE